MQLSDKNGLPLKSIMTAFAKCIYCIIWLFALEIPAPTYDLAQYVPKL